MYNGILKEKKSNICLNCYKDKFKQNQVYILKRYKLWICLFNAVPNFIDGNAIP